MNAQVQLVGQPGQNGVRDATVPHLNRGAVLDQTRNIFTDAIRDLVRWTRWKLQQRFVEGNRKVDVGQVQETIAVRSRHGRIELTNHRPGTIHGRANDVNADSEADVSVFVRQRRLDEGHVDGDNASGEKLGDLGEKDRCVIGGSLIDRISRWAADEEGIQSKIALHVVLKIRIDPERPDVQHLSVEKGLRMCLGVGNQLVDQILRIPTACPDEDPIAAVDRTEGMIRRDEFPGVKHLKSA